MCTTSPSGETALGSKVDFAENITQSSHCLVPAQTGTLPMFVTVQETLIVSPEKTVGVTVTLLTIKSAGVLVTVEAAELVLL